MQRTINEIYELILKPDGDIEIWKYGEYTIRECIYHKTYNMGDKLQDNLLQAFKVWEDCYDK